MKRAFLYLTAALLAVPTMQAAPTGYERVAFAGRYGLWGNVECIADSVRMLADTDHSLMSQMEVEARSRLARMGVPKICEPGVAPAPATMVSVELEIRTVAAADGLLVYFVRLRADLPDAELVKEGFGQLTTWESTGKLGYADGGRSHDTVRAAMMEQIDEFAEFMERARTSLDRG